MKNVTRFRASSRARAGTARGEPQHELVLSLISSGEGTLFAVLDGARDPEVHTSFKGASDKWKLLYKGKISPELAAAAPRLVAYRRRNRSRARPGVKTLALVDEKVTCLASAETSLQRVNEENDGQTRV